MMSDLISSKQRCIVKGLNNLSQEQYDSINASFIEYTISMRDKDSRWNMKKFRQSVKKSHGFTVRKNVVCNMSWHNNNGLKYEIL